MPAIEGIPYTVTGRDRLLAEPIVRGTLGFFRSLLHPEDRVSLKTCLQSVWGCSEKLSWETAGAFAKAACGTQPRAGEDQPASGMEGFLENLPCELRAEGGVRVWAALALSYLPRLSESPRELLETWAEENGYTGSSPMERLLSIAVLHQSLQDFLDTVTLGTEGDVSRSSGADIHAGRCFPDDAARLQGPGIPGGFSVRAAKGPAAPGISRT